MCPPQYDNDGGHISLTSYRAQLLPRSWCLFATCSRERNTLWKDGHAIRLCIRRVAKRSHFWNIETGQLGCFGYAQAEESLVQSEEDPRDAKDIDEADDHADHLCSQLAHITVE